MLSLEEEVHFKILDSWISANLPSPVSHKQLQAILVPIVGHEYWSLLEVMFKRGFINRDEHASTYTITEGGYIVHKALRKKKASEKLDTITKYVVDGVAIVGVILSVVLGILSLRLQRSQESSKQEIKQLTTQKDSIARVLESNRRISDSQSLRLKALDTSAAKQ